MQAVRKSVQDFLGAEDFLLTERQQHAAAGRLVDAPSQRLDAMAFWRLESDKTSAMVISEATRLSPNIVMQINTS